MVPRLGKRHLRRQVSVNGQAAADLGYVNAGTDPRVGGTLGRIAGWLQSSLSFKSAVPPVRNVRRFFGLWIETATAPNGRPHYSLALKRGDRWATVRLGWRYDANWGDAGTLGYNPQPDIVGGFVFDGVVKLRAPRSFIEGVE